MIAKGFIGECVEFARLCVSLDLAIPCGRIKLSEPPAKLGEFFARKSRDPLLERFEFAHKMKNTIFSFRGLMLSLCKMFRRYLKDCYPDTMSILRILDR
jgi:hypothetical protein